MQYTTLDLATFILQYVHSYLGRSVTRWQLGHSNKAKRGTPRPKFMACWNALCEPALGWSCADCSEFMGMHAPCWSLIKAKLLSLWCFAIFCTHNSRADSRAQVRDWRVQLYFRSNLIKSALFQSESCMS